MNKRGSTIAHCMLLCLVLVMTLGSIDLRRSGAIGIVLSPVDNHHAAGINTGQPYVGGFQVLSDNFRDYKQIDGTQVTVAFPSTNATAFPHGSWIGAGLFLQAQDHIYLFIDYAFYMIVVLDSDSNLFVDIGLHQTMEGSLPIHQPGARLVYAYTWKLTGIDPGTPITLKAEWDTERYLHYYVSAAGNEFPVTITKPSAFGDCENMMPHFYAGNVIGEQFPLGRYVDFFQFGIIGSEAIVNNQWEVVLDEPMFLKQEKWNAVDEAWSVQGDISYLDQDARWGGRPFEGVDAQYALGSGLGSHEVAFSYNGHTLSLGTLLWDDASGSSNIGIESSPAHDLTFVAQFIGYLSLAVIVSFIGLRRAPRLHSW